MRLKISWILLLGHLFTFCQNANATHAENCLEHFRVRSESLRESFEGYPNKWFCGRIINGILGACGAVGTVISAPLFAMMEGNTEVTRYGDPQHDYCDCTKVFHRPKSCYCDAIDSRTRACICYPPAQLVHVDGYQTEYLTIHALPALITFGTLTTLSLAAEIGWQTYKRYHYHLYLQAKTVADLLSEVTDPKNSDEAGGMVSEFLSILNEKLPQKLALEDLLNILTQALNDPKDGLCVLDEWGAIKPSAYSYSKIKKRIRQDWVSQSGWVVPDLERPTPQEPTRVYRTISFSASDNSMSDEEQKISKLEASAEL